MELPLIVFNGKNNKNVHFQESFHMQLSFVTCGPQVMDFRVMVG